jgi:4-hydroxy-tetrahydrodipicolinate synthase
MDINSTPLWTAVITPMNTDGSIDYDSLEKVLTAQDDANNGILILGSTGEALNIDEEESKAILEYVTKRERKVPLMCGIGGINLKSTRLWVDYLNTLNIDCYLMVSPLYAKPGDEGQYEWFKELMDASKRPVMLYNVPSRTGKELSFSAVKRLNGHHNFWAIKEASGSIEKFQQYVEAAGNGRVYSGDDAMMPEFAKHKAQGLVSVASNVWPKQTHAYVNACLNSALSDSDAKMWVESADALFTASNPIPVKWLMAQKGLIATPILRAPLTDKDMIGNESTLNAHEHVINWFKNL